MNTKKETIRLTEGQFRQIVNETVKGVLNEGYGSFMSGNGGGNPVEKWIYWCYNYTDPREWMSIFKGAPAEHFMKEFDKLGGDMNRFYLHLDKTNRPILLNYVENNFRG